MKDTIEIKQPDGSNFNEASMDSFDRFQEVQNVYRQENGKLVLKKQPFSETWSPERKREKAAEILSGKYITYCAFAGKSVVGALLLLPELDNGRLIIDSFHVSREYRRRGIGQRLFETAVDYARSHGAEALYASCCSAEETIDFYLAMGFRPSEHPIVSYVEAEPFDIQMECKLTARQYEIVKLSQRKELKGKAAEWFAAKWSAPLEAYLESIEASFSAVVPSWYVCLKDGRIVAGIGVIENDFHERKDLTPNVCAVYTEPACRKCGLAGRLLDFVCEDMHAQGIDILYLLTDHIGFYERYGWVFHCLVRGDGEEKPSRMYVHKWVKSLVLKSERLLIAPMRIYELKESVAAQKNPELQQAFQEMLDACLKEPEHRIWYAPWKISLADKPTEVIGELGFRGPAVNGEVEIGYGLHPEFEGHGYMTEAVQAVIQWAFSLSGITSIIAETAPDNHHSQRILNRLGFVQCGMGEEGPRFRKDNVSGLF